MRRTAEESEGEDDFEELERGVEWGEWTEAEKEERKMGAVKGHREGP